jgi:5-deoxy-glucuronate isomerase
MRLHWPTGSLTGKADGEVVDMSPDTAGWDWAGLQVLRLGSGEQRVVRTGDAEVFVLPLAGSLHVAVAHADRSQVTEAAFDLQGRDSVFTRVTDFGYAGRDSVLTLASAAGAEVALPSARCVGRLPARYGPAQDVPVEVRGAGAATRQVTMFGSADAWPHAQRLLACELLTPPGNWSSFPPHKHDRSEPCEVVNEEIYYYRIAGRDQLTPGPEGFGVHRTYTGAEHRTAGLPDINLTVEVHDGDVVLVPHGYHGPCMASPGYPMYYLNVLAGPGERSMAFCDDPRHGWLRSTWADTPPDPRVPMTTTRPTPGGGAT